MKDKSREFPERLVLHKNFREKNQTLSLTVALQKNRIPTWEPICKKERLKFGKQEGSLP
jgi:hypothetical protein